jgi:DNA-binding winged helix-turn-helix (wHTH) protein
MIYHFANCSIDPERHAFLRDEKSIHVEPQVFELLRALVSKQGRLTTKDDLVKTVWNGFSVSDATISARINAARKAVGDNGKDQAIIKTVHGLGFQLIVDVTTVPKETSQAPVLDPVGIQSIRFARSSHNAKIAFAKSGTGPPLLRVGHWLSHLELDWQSSVWLPLLEAFGSKHTLYRYEALLHKSGEGHSSPFPRRP